MMRDGECMCVCVCITYSPSGQVTPVNVTLLMTDPASK